MASSILKTMHNQQRTSIVKFCFLILIFVVCFVISVIISSDQNQTKSKVEQRSTPDKVKIKNLFPHHNSTHLWSMPFADDKYFQLARLLPCRSINYTGGPGVNQINSCDYSSTNEFSLENTLKTQKWLYEHQHPTNCSNKRFAIIRTYALSGFGSTIHQVVWAFGAALAQDRIAVYETPGHWLYGTCSSGTPDCFFLPITNCSIPSKVDGNQTIHINADVGHWSSPVHPPIFQNRTFNWYRAQLLFYLLRYKPEILTHAQNTIAQYFKPSAIELHHPFIALYVRRSDKVTGREMSQAYSLKQYFDLFDADARKANIRNIYINSEDQQVFSEFIQLNKEKNGYYNLLSIQARKNVVFGSLTRMPQKEREQVVLEFLTDLYIEANADLHAGTLTSNWCRLVDEMRLTLGKISPYYTPENRYLLDM
ncbi:unnamed protein product [Adineta steineri]|uniref:Alpha-(1,6)-fucosyltransferase N- and catalytic domain-containing protein n=2 Tax=Adineta steineri TaxID=433720 RepID=A0A814NGZ4_9BILA|nr:unnamed protein product [Adineta steineri]CAF3559474.1 unnamed protein product [Adineta steineri]